MLIKKRTHWCLIASGMVSLILFMTLLYSGSSGGGLRRSSSSLRHDYQLMGRPLYKLDLGWPNNPEIFTGEVFCVAVNQYAAVVYVAQRGTHLG